LKFGVNKYLKGHVIKPVFRRFNWYKKFIYYKKDYVWKI
jgi:hypothetical protein